MSLDASDEKTHKIEGSVENLADAYKDEVSWLKELREMLEAYRKILKSKNMEIEELHDQIEALRVKEMGLIGRDKSARELEAVFQPSFSAAKNITGGKGLSR